MKKVGFVFIAAGLAILAFILLNIFNEQNTIKSPLPAETGVKVLFISPTQK